MIQECVTGVTEFQSLCGKLDSPATRETLQDQMKLITEEAKELSFAIDNESSEQVLKEMCDLLVVVTGMVAMLNRSGYRVYEAWRAVNDNNMTKFSASQTDGYYTLAGYEATNNGSYELRQVDIDKWGCFNDNNKLMKPIGYTKISVKEFTPQRKEQ